MNKLRIAINGFGRIGRQVLKAMIEHHADAMEVVAINDLFDIRTNAHLLSHDTCYGRFPPRVVVEDNLMRIGEDYSIVNLAERDPRLLPWGDLGVDVVLAAALIALEVLVVKKGYAKRKEEETENA